MTRTSLHALILSIVFAAAISSDAALPQHRPFFATIKNSSSGSEKCLGFDVNGMDRFPSLMPNSSRPNCGFASVDLLLANKHSVWRLLPLGNDLYTLSNNSKGEQCLIFSSNGAERFPSRLAWSAGEYCGYPGGKGPLLQNKQAIFKITDLGNDQYIITNASAREGQCVIIGGNGADPNPSRWSWGPGPYCGYPGGRVPFMANKQGVWKIEPVGPTDVLDQLFEHVYKLDRNGDYLGKTYSLTTDNALPSQWVVQTPNVWGKRASEVQNNAGIDVATKVSDLITNAAQQVDIMTLVPFPTGEYETRVRTAIEALARSGRHVTVRILGGWPPFNFHTNQFDYLRRLIANIKNIPNNNVQIYVGANRFHRDTAWNHAKIVAVDGQKMLIGGQNFWEDDYLRANPAHDLSMVVQGPSTVLGHRFADEAWKAPCNRGEPEWKPAYWRAGMRDVGSQCPPTASFNPRGGPGSARVLTVGRLARFPGLEEASEQAMRKAFDATSGPLRLSQQDLGYRIGIVNWDPILIQIARAVHNQRDVFIVLSADGAKAGTGTPYQNATMAETAHALFREARAQAPNMRPDDLKNLLCSKLRLAPLRFGPDKQWASGFGFANHTKFWMAGDSLFYVGAHNLYPTVPVGNASGLQELGVIVNNAAGANEIKQSYWDPLWNYSKVDAVSGQEASTCIFRNMD